MKWIKIACHLGRKNYIEMKMFLCFTNEREGYIMTLQQKNEHIFE